MKHLSLSLSLSLSFFRRGLHAPIGSARVGDDLETFCLPQATLRSQLVSWPGAQNRDAQRGKTKRWDCIAVGVLGPSKLSLVVFDGE